MNNTIVIYESSHIDVKNFSGLLARTLGPSKVISAEDFDGNFEPYNNIILCFSEFIKMSDFIDANCSQISSKKTALFEASDVVNAKKNLDILKKELGKNVLYSGFIDKSMSLKDISNQVVRVKRIFKDSSDMPLKMLKDEICKFLISHNTCTLCTGGGTNVRATPIEYIYFNGSIYFISEGGEKFANIYSNMSVSTAIYEDYKDFKSLKGLQVSGKAVLIEPFSREYTLVFQKKNINMESIKKMPIVMNMLKLVPERYEVLSSEFAKKGYSPKQTINL